MPTLRNFRLEHLREEGYVNLRCTWAVGCPAEIRPLEDEGHASKSPNEMPTVKGVFSRAWRELMPEVPVPEVIAVSCCSQFAVTMDTVRSRPLADYVRFRDWLLDTPLEDALSGRVFEFSWHSKFASCANETAPLSPQRPCIYDSLIQVLFLSLADEPCVAVIFGKEAVHCPSAKECYCKTFGICDTPCTEYTCEERYTLPPYSLLPQGWPLVGWEGEARQFPGPLD